MKKYFVGAVLPSMVNQYYCCIFDNIMHTGENTFCKVFGKDEKQCKERAIALVTILNSIKTLAT